MKKVFSMPIFFVMLIMSAFSLHVKCGNISFAHKNEREITFNCGEYNFSYKENDLIKNRKFLDKFSTAELLTKLQSMGFSIEDCLNYVYGNLSLAVNEMSDIINEAPLNAGIDVSSGMPKVEGERAGRCIDINALYKELFKNMKQFGDGNIVVNLSLLTIEPTIKLSEVEKLTNEKASFTTYINGVNQEGRIHNIKRATELLNGIVVMPNESLSFNKVIGDTTKANGYELAKVILNGKYEEDYGGGVCQVATTLYNASLIAGLDIESVRPHSLKVGYVAGSFDAMVSAGWSDLVIKNCYSSPIYIHATASDYDCKIKIFGEENEYLIKRRAEIIDIEDEEKDKISYKSIGYLDYYKDGVLIKSDKIRKDTYKKVKVEESSTLTFL